MIFLIQSMKKMDGIFEKVIEQTSIHKKQNKKHKFNFIIFLFFMALLKLVIIYWIPNEYHYSSMINFKKCILRNHR